MFAAAIIYSLCVMTLSSMAAHFYDLRIKHARPLPRRMHFYLSYLRFGALIALVLLTYPILFGLTEPATVRTFISGPVDTTFGLLLVLGAAMALSWFGTATVIASWVLLLQGILFVTWVFSRISTSLGQDVLLYPAWQFFGLSCVLCAACLLMIELVLWFPASNQSARQMRVLREMGHQLCVVPALAIYSMGLGLRL